MRLSVISTLLLLSSAGYPAGLTASVNADSMASDSRLQAAMESEFLFQSGEFSAAFRYYRNRPLTDLNAQELRRSRQIAQVLGDTQWLQEATSAVPGDAAANAEGMMQRFEALVRQGQSRPAALAWRDLIRTGPDDFGLLAARDAINSLFPDYRQQLQNALSAFAALPDLSPDERFELFGFAYQWRMEDTAETMKSGLSAGSWQSSMAELISQCIDGQPDDCASRLQSLAPDNLDDNQRRSVLAIALDNGNALQIQRWLQSLPQDGGTYYQRIVNLHKNPDPAQIETLRREIAGNAGLSVFQRAALLGSIAELNKEWTAAESHYRDALAAGKPTSAALRLPVVLMRQNRREQAYAQLRAVQDNPAYSDEMRREAFRTEIQFNRILRVDGEAQDPVYRRALAYWPDAHDLRYQYAMQLFDRDQTERSLSQLQAIIRQAPANAEALNAYGYTLAKDLDRAKDGFKPIQKAYLLAPGQGEILDSYGYVLHRLGRDREALPFLQKAMSLMPSAVTAGHLARVYLELGDATQAQEALKKGLELDAGDAELLDLQEHMH